MMKIISHLPYLISFWLIFVGILGIALSNHLVRIINCLIVSQSSTYILLLVAGFRENSGAPVFYDVAPGTPSVDPVVQSLVLTDIVIGASVMALLLSFTLRQFRLTETVDPAGIKEVSG
jgi:multicomponent Na+:H+ antiporter subunit C